MDKDMERLGKERLKRVKRRRQLATFVISMAVIVLSITVYRLIQPASAEDQNQRDFTIDSVTENYVNLEKLTGEGSKTSVKSEGKSADWNGEKFKFEIQLDFSIGKSDISKDGTANNNYYYVFDSNVSVPDELCNIWKVSNNESTGKEDFKYRFVKNEDGTYAVLIKFVDGYLSDATDTVVGYVKAEALGYGKTDQSGNVNINIGGDVTVTVEKDKIKWDGDKSLNYDISVDKKNTTNNTLGIDENGKRYAEYTLEITSKKGTPGDINISDIFYGNGMKVDTESFKYTISKNGNTVSDNAYNAIVKVDSSNANNVTLTATLPKLQANESCTLTYRYYISNTDELSNGTTYYASNKVTAESTDQNKEKVVDTSSSSISYKKEIIEKVGKYDSKNNKIEWTIKVNAEKSDIAGAKLTDTMFYSLGTNDIKISPNSGYTVNTGSDGKISSITFNAVDGNLNCNEYIITYSTDATPQYEKQKINNTATIDKNNHSDSASKDVEVPAMDPGVYKKFDSDVKGENNIYTLNWTSGFNITTAGIPVGATLRDKISESNNGANDHYMTYAQAKELIDQINEKFNGYIDDIKVELNGGGSKVSFSTLDANNSSKITDIYTKFIKAYPGGENEQKIEFKYQTTADCSTPGTNTYKNTFKAYNKDADASYEHTTSSVKKGDKDGNESQTYLKTTESDGTLTWRVDVLMDADSTEYTIQDTMPEGVEVESVTVNMRYCGSGGFTLNRDSLDGVEHVDISQDDSDWHTRGISTSSKLETQDGKDIITTVVKKPTDSTKMDGWGEKSHIYVTYKCKIKDFDDFKENMTEGSSKDFINTVKAWSDSNSDIGTSEHTQTISKPKTSSDDKPDSGEKVITKDYVWDNDNHMLKYTVVINPNAIKYLTTSDTLQLKDVLTYTPLTYWPSQGLLRIDLLPASVEFHEAVKNEDGTYSSGDIIDTCTWTYDTTDATVHTEIPSNIWCNENSTRTINASIPDGRAIILTYTYKVNVDILGNGDSKGAQMKVSNTASLSGIENGSDSKNTQEIYTDAKTSAGVTKSNTFTLYKVDKDNYGKQLAGAEFELFEFDGSAYKSLGKYTTDKNGKIDISMTSKNLIYNKQYYVIETKAPNGYILSDEPVKAYFYFSNSDTSNYPINAESATLQGSDMAKVNTPYYYEDEVIPTTEIYVNKNWTDSKGDTITKTDGSIYLQLHQVDSEGNDTKSGNVVAITPDENGNWSYTFSNLPLKKTDDIGKLTSSIYKYYVEEVGINENNNMSGYEVSYTYKDQNGNNVGSAGAAVSAGKDMALDGGTIEITNKLNEYELPETGGSGNRWLYMLSGVVLMTIATITLFYKKQKLI